MLRDGNLPLVSLREALAQIGTTVDPARLLDLLASESDMFLMLRDHAGRIVYGNRSVEQPQRPPPPDVIGKHHLPGRRFFDESGRELAILEHPAQVARITGIAQRNVRLTIRLESGDHRCLQMSYIPLDQGDDGWSVLSVGCDVTELRASVAA
jgi:hypothetical protein